MTKKSVALSGSSKNQLLTKRAMNVRSIFVEIIFIKYRIFFSTQVKAFDNRILSNSIGILAGVQ